MLVRDFMTKRLRCVEEDEPIHTAERWMRKYKIRRLPVLSKGKLVGIVTWSDVQAALPSIADLTQTPQQKLHIIENPVSLIMSKKVLTVHPDDRLTQAALLMAENKVAGLPVVDGDRLVGILTETDVFKAFIRVLGVSGRSERRVFPFDRGNETIREVLDRLDAKLLTVQSMVTYRDKDDGKRKLIVWAVERGSAPRKSARAKKAASGGS
ncbi:MAG: CBS domain-containing protein [Planctomycetes bacterium]|nr:CBS domain-containing protein [Planctomycetota bacterium]